MNIFSSRLITALLAANIIFLLGAVLYLILYDTEGLPSLDNTQESYSLNEFQQRPSRTMVQMEKLEKHPLFHQNRKEFIVKKAAPVRKAEPRRENPLTAYQLKGIVYINGGNSVIMIENRNNGQSYKLKTGDDFDGWTIKTIHRNFAEFRRGTELGRLELLKSGNNNR